MLLIEVDADQPSSNSVLKAALKQQIKQDAVDIRARKQHIRMVQKSYGDASSDQSRLVYVRSEARARLLIYGLLRGKTWDQMEQKHEMTTALKYSLQRVFKACQDLVKQQTGETLSLPEAVQLMLNG